MEIDIANDSSGNIISNINLHKPFPQVTIKLIIYQHLLWLTYYEQEEIGYFADRTFIVLLIHVIKLGGKKVLTVISSCFSQQIHVFHLMSIVNVTFVHVYRQCHAIIEM